MKIMDGLVAFGCALVFAASLPAQTNVPVAPRDGQRYLFVVDTSASNRKIDDGTRQALFDLIYFGIDGQMKKGDTFGIWTFNEKVSAGQVPMQTWDPDKVLGLASLAAKYIQAQKFEGKSVPQAALARVVGIVRNVRDLNILLLTDGETPLAGTTFNHQVNPVYEQRGREREKSKKPFIVTFIARGGQVTNASVTLAGEPILVPPPSPEPPKQVVLRPKAQGTNLAAPVRRTIRRTNSTPLIIRPSTPPLHAATPVPASASTNLVASAAETPSPVLHPADLIGSNEALGFSPQPHSSGSPSNVVAAEAQTSGVRQSIAQPAAPAAVPPVVTAPPSNLARVPRTTNSGTSVGINVFPDTPVAAREASFANAPAIPRSGLSPVALIATGALLLTGAVGVLVFGLRRNRTASARPSFISQSMDRP